MLFDIERDEQENKRQKIEEKEKENSTPSETSRVIGVEGGNIAATAAKKELSPATLGTNPPQADTLVQMENTPIPRWTPFISSLLVSAHTYI